MTGPVALATSTARLLRRPARSFLGVGTTDDASRVDTPYAFVGIPFGPPYEEADLTVCAGAASAVRDVTYRMEYDSTWQHHDFDLNGPLFPDGMPNVTDIGDVIGDVREPDRIWDDAITVARELVSGGRVPLALGGLDAVPPMVVAGFVGVETVNVLHVDAHLDFREEVNGVTRGYSSPIRRIRELQCVDHMVQVGMRSVGSARPADVADAVAAGNRIVTAWDLHARGPAALLDELPDDHRWVITIDCDGLDPVIAPAVGWPEPGGLTFPEVGALVRGLARRDAIAAMVVTEFQPARDFHQVTAQTIARLLINVIGIQRTPQPRGTGATT